MRLNCRSYRLSRSLFIIVGKGNIHPDWLACTKTAGLGRPLVARSRQPTETDGSPAVRWPIRNQIFVPFAAMLLAAVTLIAVSAAFLAARRSERNTVRQLNQVIQTLGQSSFPYSQNVLEKMRGLSGAEFVVFDRQKTVLGSTLPKTAGMVDAVAEIPRQEQVASLGAYPTIQVAETRYFASTVERPGQAGARTLLVLYPETTWKQARWEAALPPLAVGIVTVLLMVVVSAWVANRLGRRIQSVQRQVASIAEGDFREVTIGDRRDEIQELVASVNQMCAQLQAMQQTIRESERSRLLGQLAGGLAHQLRNAVTGARMAVQIHSKRCSNPPGDESLSVALRQLSLTEEQVKGLLSLGKTEHRPPVACEIGELVADVAALVDPACEHAEVAFQHSVLSDEPCVLSDSESVRAAVLNLTLNAIEAAGSPGQAGLDVHAADGNVTFDVWDNGPGPPAELADSLFDPFATSKPEGVGLGLALAKQVADAHGGELSWRRIDGRTCFRLMIPLTESNIENPQSEFAQP